MCCESMSEEDPFAHDEMEEDDPFAEAEEDGTFPFSLSQCFTFFQFFRFTPENVGINNNNNNNNKTDPFAVDNDENDDKDPFAENDDNDPFAENDENDPFASTKVDDGEMEIEDDGEYEVDDVNVEIPRWVKQSFRADVEELDELQYVAANSSINYTTGTMTVFIAISKERFMLSSERAHAYMMDKNKEICFRITFGKYYCGDLLNQQRNLTEVKPVCPEIDPKIVQANVKARDALSARVFRDNDKCAMAWYLENRLKIYFQGDSSGDVSIPGVWPPMLDTRGWERPILKHFIRSEVRQVMRSLDCNENVATKILEECNEDIEMAVNFMNDNFERYSKIMEECGEFDEDDDTNVASSQSQSNTTQSKEESDRVSREQKRLDAFVRISSLCIVIITLFLLIMR